MRRIMRCRFVVIPFVQSLIFLCSLRIPVRECAWSVYLPVVDVSGKVPGTLRWTLHGAVAASLEVLLSYVSRLLCSDSLTWLTTFRRWLLSGLADSMHDLRNPYICL